MEIYGKIVGRGVVMDNFEFENKKKKKLRKEPFYIVGCLLCLVIGAGGGYFYRGSQEKTNQKTS